MGSVHPPLTCSIWFHRTSIHTILDERLGSCNEPGCTDFE
jgi:hypothetical protein